MRRKIDKFTAKIGLLGINPFVFVPESILQNLFDQAGKNTGKIPVCGMINGLPFKQTLVKYNGDWRLYINTSMLKNSPRRIGENLLLAIAFDSSDRTIPPPPALVTALRKNKKAKAVFDNLRPSLQLEIVRYIANLKTEESIKRNVIKATNFLLGKSRFVGRDKP